MGFNISFPQRLRLSPQPSAVKTKNEAVPNASSIDQRLSPHEKVVAPETSARDFNRELNLWFFKLSDQHPDLVERLESGAKRLQFKIRENGPTITFLKDAQGDGIMLTVRIPDPTVSQPREEVITFTTVNGKTKIENYVVQDGKIIQSPPSQLKGETKSRINARATAIATRLLEYAYKRPKHIKPIPKWKSTIEIEQAKHQIPKELLDKYFDLASQSYEARDLSDPTQTPHVLTSDNGQTLPDINARINPNTQKIEGYILVFQAEDFLFSGKYLYAVVTDTDGKILSAQAKRITRLPVEEKTAIFDLPQNYWTQLSINLQGRLRYGIQTLESKLPQKEQVSAPISAS